MKAAGARRRFIAPEIIQTSSMDCGPAALKSLLNGYDIPVSYGRLREACQTDIDGTSIDTIEEIARLAGLDAEQVLVPVDHVLLAESQCLPCIAAVRGPAGYTHFIVLWRTHGTTIQIMDPARGRLWLRRSSLIDQLVTHSMTVPADSWRGWATSDDFLVPLRRRLHDIGLSASQQAAVIEQASNEPGCLALATLDAAARMVRSLCRSGAVSTRSGYVTLTRLSALALNAIDATSVIPESYWSARPGSATSNSITIRGAVLVRAKGARGAEPRSERLQASPELAAAFSERPIAPMRDLLRTIDAGTQVPWLLAAALILSVIGVVLEALLLRSTVDLRQMLQGPGQAIWSGAALVIFAALLLGLELFCATSERRLGNHLEARLRMAFLDKLPKLSDAYFLSRPVADMLERSHTLHTLRTLPRLAVRFSRVSLELLVTSFALIWLAPGTGGLVIVAGLAAALIPFAGQALIAERDLRARTHTGALAKFHLDALRGRTTVEAHGAAGAIEKEHELKLAEWAASTRSLQRASLTIEGVQMTVGFGLAAWMLLGHAGESGGAPLLLQAYWMLSLPGLGYELALIAREYPALKTTALRVLEPLGAPETSNAGAQDLPPSSTHGVSLSFLSVSVRVAGHTVLDNVSVNVAAGEHIAIVGPSGAGKSTLAGLVLGWYRASSGDLFVDDVALNEQGLLRLRQTTAWVDPTIQLWNRSLLDNLLYAADADPDALGSVLDGADLLSMIARLPDGLATILGEGGALLSGGEAQRVRLGRALLKRAPRLAILDEPFVGLERDRRRSLLSYARQRWARATLLYVTHDVPETRGFDRVIVVDHGRIVEDGDPRQLANSASSRYRRLLVAHEAAQNRLLNGEWRRLRFEGGRVTHERARSNDQTA